MDQYSRVEFGKYITDMREKHEVNMEQLCEGLLDLSMLGRFEKGERFPDKLTRDRLLARMGETADSYENYLHYDEYTLWKLRQQLLQAIVDLNNEKAKQILCEYKNTCDMKNPVEKQFVLAMEAMLLKREMSDKEVLRGIYAEALKLTVPYTDIKRIGQMCLSMQELYLVLQYAYYNVASDEKLIWYKALLEYISKSPLDQVCRAKIYPQTVYYLYRAVKEEIDINEEIQSKVLNYCDEAVDMLRDAGGSYYLWEILQIRKEILHKNEKWLWAIEEVRKEFDRPFTMQDECYLYVEKEAYCIGDVVKQRRKMLGLTREKLAKESKCSLKTIEKLETYKNKTQRLIVKDLFECLNLPREFQRTDLLTNSFKTQRLMEELRWCVNERKTARVDEILDELEQIVPMDIPMNRQVLMKTRICNRQEKGMVTKADVVNEIREILEYTIPYEVVVSGKNCYMTNEEIVCVHNMVNRMTWEDAELERCVNFLHNYYSVYEKEESIGMFINMYELVMTGVASQLGNKGEYDKSDEIGEGIALECLKWNRITFIPHSIYNATWNYEQRKKARIPVNSDRNVRRDIELCIAFSDFGKRKFIVQSYQRKLQQRIEQGTIE